MYDRRKQIANEAAHEALRFIQSKLGTEDYGGFAGTYWSPARWGSLVLALADYIYALERFIDSTYVFDDRDEAAAEGEG